MADCYGRCPPGSCNDDLPGHLIVIEGQDGVGRSTHIGQLTDWLESRGHAVAQVGLSRSHLAGPELREAKEGHDLRPYAMGLFYAADFFDQMENMVVPALRAGMVVLADRWVHTLMARQMVRGVDPDVLRSVYQGALVPDVVFRLQAKPKNLVERLLHKQGQLDYWESGMDMGLSNDWYDSFLKYQKRLERAWKDIGKTHAFVPVNGNRTVKNVQDDLREQLKPILRKAKPAKADVD